MWFFLCSESEREQISFKGRFKRRIEEDNKMFKGSLLQNLGVITEKALSPMHEKWEREERGGEKDLSKRNLLLESYKYKKNKINSM